MASTIAMPTVPRISTYTPTWATRRHHLRAGDVHRRLDEQQDERDHQDHGVAGRVQVPVEPVLQQRRGVADHADVHGRDRDEQRDAVEPAHEPAVAPADVVLAVLVQRARDRVVAGQLAEDQGDEQHARHRDPGRPHVAGAAGADAEQEQRVDADHRRQVRERDREVREQPEHAAQLRPVAEALQPCVIAVSGSRGLWRRLVHEALLFPYRLGGRRMKSGGTGPRQD